MSGDLNPVTGSLRGQTLLGLAWMISQSISTKLVSVIGQLTLAYLLLPQHFAPISLAYSVMAFIRVLENGGLREVLIHRSAELDRWVNPAFWLSLFLGIVAFLLTLILAPISGYLFQSSEVTSLLLLLSINPILISLTTAPIAKLQSDHQFRKLAALTALQGCSQIVATVLFAWLGYGAFSFALGILAASILHTCAVWWTCSPTIRSNPQTSLWNSLWQDTLMLTLVGLATTVIQNVDYMMLGIYHKLEVGLYFFAFGLATQTTQILSNNIASVFLPVLCKLQSDTDRQLQASLKSLKVLAAIGIPLSFLQCGLTDAGFKSFLPSEWWPAIPYAQILSLGLGLNLMSSLCWSLLKSQGRFHTVLYLNSIGAIVFTAAVAMSAKWGSPQTVAWVVVVFCAIYSPVVLWISIHRIGGNVPHIVSIFGIAILASLVSLFASWQLEKLVPELPVEQVIQFPGFSFTLKTVFIRLIVVSISFVAVCYSIFAIARHPLVEEFHRFLGRLPIPGRRKAT